MQEFANYLERLEKLKITLGLKSDDALAERLGLSKRTINYAKDSPDKVTTKTRLVIESAERDAGLLPPEPVRQPPPAAPKPPGADPNEIYEPPNLQALHDKMDRMQEQIELLLELMRCGCVDKELPMTEALQLAEKIKKKPKSKTA